jgi:DNA-binding NarL/FixJ family response regulator
MPASLTGTQPSLARKRRPIGVVIHSADPVVRSGVEGFLRHRPEVVLLGGDDPAASVLIVCVDSVDDTALQVMRKSWRTKAMRTLLIAGQLREAELYSALECGVVAIVHRHEASPDKVIHAIQMADRGAGDLPPDMLGGLLGHIGLTLRSGHRGGNALALARFSQREIDVVRLVSEGLDTREIAQKLSYSERTVKNVLQGIMLRLDLRNRAHVVAYAAREGYLR